MLKKFGGFRKMSYLCIIEKERIIFINSKRQVMDREQILNVIRGLAMSQGFYGRLLQQIDEDTEILDELENQHFTDVVDLILYIEG